HNLVADWRAVFDPFIYSREARLVSRVCHACADLGFGFERCSLPTARGSRALRRSEDGVDVAHDRHEGLVDGGGAAEECLKAIKRVWVCGRVLGYAPKRLTDHTDLV